MATSYLQKRRKSGPKTSVLMEIIKIYHPAQICKHHAHRCYHGYHQNCFLAWWWWIITWWKPIQEPIVLTIINHALTTNETINDSWMKPMTMETSFVFPLFHGQEFGPRPEIAPPGAFRVKEWASKIRKKIQWWLGVALFQETIWRFPEMGVPLVIIHSFLGFSIINHHFWGTPIYGNPHFEDTLKSLASLIWIESGCLKWLQNTRNPADFLSMGNSPAIGVLIRR